MSKHTPGTWSVGKHGGEVISDQIPSDYIPGSGHDATEHYGGFLIAESVHSRDVHLLAASKVLLEALLEVLPHAEVMINANHPSHKKAVAAIQKATQ